MKTQKSNRPGAGSFHVHDYISQTILLGVLGVLVVFLSSLFPLFWKDHWIFVSLLAAGLSMPALFSLWNFWAGYGWQVGIAPGLMFILMSIFIWFFGYDSGMLWLDAVANLFWTNLLVLAIWLVLVLFAFRGRPQRDEGQAHRRGEVWRDYRWIIAPAVLILLFLFDISWAQSTLSTSSLEKSIINTTRSDTLELQVEYPSQIFFEDANGAEVHFWTNHSFGQTEQVRLRASAAPANQLLFAIKPQSDEPVEWRAAQSFTLDKDTRALTLLVQPIDLQEANSRSIQLKLRSNGKSLDTTDWAMTIESKRASQIRGWKKNFLDTGGTVVSLITAVFVGVKQLEEEKKRQKSERTKQVITTFDTDVKNDFSKTLGEHLELVRDWSEWDKALQDQFCDKYSSFVEKDLWQVLADKTPTAIKSDIESCLQILERIFEGEGEKLISTVQQLQSALQQGGYDSLSLIRNYPQSTVVVKRIVKSYPQESKDRITKDFHKEYLREIKLLGRELAFPTGYPLLASMFWRYSTDKNAEEKLKKWLGAHDLVSSPFWDSETPFTYMSAGTEKFLIDQAAPGFSFDLRSKNQTHFKFKNTWDLQAAVYSFCKDLPTGIASQAFIVFVSPSLFINFEKEPAVNLALRALAEQWLITVADEPTMFYDLNTYQQRILARLFCWHYGSSPAVLARLSEEIDKRSSWIFSKSPSPDEELRSNNIRDFIRKAPDWLEGVPTAPLAIEETNGIVDLRPSSTYRTFMLIPSTDLSSTSQIRISLKKHQAFDAILDWLDLHRYTLILFHLSNQEWWRIKEDLLIQNLRGRINLCVSQENISLDKKINSFNDFFILHDKDEPADLILARKANGSPGEMVRLGQKLLLQHVEKCPPEEDLHIEDLIVIE